MAARVSTRRGSTAVQKNQVAGMGAEEEGGREKEKRFFRVTSSIDR